MKPKFQHDCPNCKFLGHYHKGDVYVCFDSNMTHGTILYRFEDVGQEYTSINLDHTRRILQNPENQNLDYVKAFNEALKQLSYTSFIVKRLEVYAYEHQGFGFKS